MCRNGRFTEAGIRGLDGYTAEMLALPVDFAVKVGADPGSLGSGGAGQRGGQGMGARHPHRGRARWAAHRVLVTGAGPIGLLAALFAMRVAEEVPCHRPGRRRAQAGSGG